MDMSQIGKRRNGDPSSSGLSTPRTSGAASNESSLKTVEDIDLDGLMKSSFMAKAEDLIVLMARRSREARALIDRIALFSSPNTTSEDFSDVLQLELDGIAQERKALQEAFHGLADVAQTWAEEKRDLECRLSDSQRETAEMKKLVMNLCNETSEKLALAREANAAKEAEQMKSFENSRLSMQGRIRELENDLSSARGSLKAQEILAKRGKEALQIELQKALKSSALVRRQWQGRARSLSDRKIKQNFVADPFQFWARYAAHQSRFVVQAARVLYYSKKCSLKQSMRVWRAEAAHNQDRRAVFVEIARQAVLKERDFTLEKLRKRKVFLQGSGQTMELLGSVGSCELVAPFLDRWRMMTRLSIQATLLKDATDRAIAKEAELISSTLLQQAEADADPAHREDSTVTASIEKSVQAGTTHEDVACVNAMDCAVARLEESVRSIALVQDGTTQEEQACVSAMDSAVTRLEELVSKTAVPHWTAAPNPEHVEDIARARDDVDAFKVVMLQEDVECVQVALKEIRSRVEGSESEPSTRPQKLQRARSDDSGSNAVAENGILGLAFDDNLSIIDVVKFSPAYTAGNVQVGDKLVKVGNRDIVVDKLNKNDVAQALQGQVDSVVEIMVEKGDKSRASARLIRMSRKDLLRRLDLRKELELFNLFLEAKETELQTCKFLLSQSSRQVAELESKLSSAAAATEAAEWKKQLLAEDKQKWLSEKEKLTNTMSAMESQMKELEKLAIESFSSEHQTQHQIAASMPPLRSRSTDTENASKASIKDPKDLTKLPLESNYRLNVESPVSSPLSARSPPRSPALRHFPNGAKSPRVAHLKHWQAADTGNEGKPQSALNSPSIPRGEQEGSVVARIKANRDESALNSPRTPRGELDGSFISKIKAARDEGNLLSRQNAPRTSICSNEDAVSVGAFSTVSGISYLESNPLVLIEWAKMLENVLAVATGKPLLSSEVVSEEIAGTLDELDIAIARMEFVIAALDTAAKYAKSWKRFWRNLLHFGQLFALGFAFGLFYADFEAYTAVLFSGLWLKCQKMLPYESIVARLQSLPSLESSVERLQLMVVQNIDVDKMQAFVVAQWIALKAAVPDNFNALSSLLQKQEPVAEKPSRFSILRR